MLRFSASLGFFKWLRGGLHTFNLIMHLFYIISICLLCHFFLSCIFPYIIPVFFQYISPIFFQYSHTVDVDLRTPKNKNMDPAGKQLCAQFPADIMVLFNSLLLHISPYQAWDLPKPEHCPSQLLPSMSDWSWEMLYVELIIFCDVLDCLGCNGEKCKGTSKWVIAFRSSCCP